MTGETRQHHQSKPVALTPRQPARLGRWRHRETAWPRAGCPHRKPPDAQDLFVRLEHVDPGDGGSGAGQMGACPLDGDSAAYRGRLPGDHGVGLPVSQAAAALGIVVVANVDHIASLKQPRRHWLAGHDTPFPRGKCCHSTYNCTTLLRDARM